MIKQLKIVVLVFSFLLSGISYAATSGEQLKYIPVQDGGRIKPFDSLARETLELLYGRSQYKNESTSRKEPAYLIVTSFMLSPESWMDIPLFEVSNHDVKKYLGLSLEVKHFKGRELFTGDKFANLMQELSDKRLTKEKLNPYYQAVQRLENQFLVFKQIAEGKYFKVLPSVENTEPAVTWVSVADLPEDYKNLFIVISQKMAIHLGEIGQSGQQSTDAFKSAQDLDEAVEQFQQKAKQEFPHQYAQKSAKTGLEVFYNKIHFFRLSYVFYLLAAVLLLFSWIRNLKKSMTLVWAFTLLGFSFQIIGFCFRVYLAERAPVTNMYETVVWVSFGAVLFAMILEKIYKYKSILLAGLLVGIFSMIVADVAPAILDPSIQPLEAVLRSNYWLVTHVMTITISYAAFFLAFALGDIGLIYQIINPKKYQEHIKNISTGIYRSMQIGIAFLAPGIILGGIWADYSWGRFWGWDPKETWALIVLLGYIIILHAKLVNWLQNFGMMVGGILAFNLVIMAWYGVNYVLGAGLHSYGWGAGGVEYVSIFCLIHFLFVAYAAIIRKSQKNV